MELLHLDGNPIRHLCLQEIKCSLTQVFAHEEMKRLGTHLIRIKLEGTLGEQRTNRLKQLGNSGSGRGGHRERGHRPRTRERSLNQICLGVNGDDRDLKWFLKSGKAPEIWCRLVNGLVEVKYYVNSFEHIERRYEHPHLQSIGRFKQS